MPEVRQWLTLTQAAEKLGVHPTTLRRWADQGQLPVMLTPGGHRRFAVEEVEQFTEQQQRLRVVSGLEQIWAIQALNYTRKGLTSQREASWLTVFDEQERKHKRMLGRRLIGLMLRYIAAEEGGEEILQEAHAIGLQYAENAIRQDLPLTEALQATMFFRDNLVEAAIHLPETTHVRPEANNRLLRRISVLVNTLQLAIAEMYEQGQR